jgi:putative membrane protein
MWLYSIVTYLHFISIFILFSALIIELSIIKRKMTRSNFILLKKADLFFGIFALLTVATGLFRIYYYGKGEDYYLSNLIFVLKVSLFILVGLLSIYPALQFLKSRKLNIETVELKNFRIIRFLFIIEVILLLIIPFLAVLVAKGIEI